jgi:uncharacterized protein (TIGR02001 family)
MRLLMSAHWSVKRKPLTAGARCGALAALCALPLAQAQIGVGATVTSEYVARGMSLSQGRPVPQLRVDVDTGGWYAGALVARISPPDSDANMLLLAYGGYARRLPSGLSWEAGALNSTFAGAPEYRYHEFYAGLAGERLAGRVYFSPSYYGDASTLYAEVNGTYPLRDRLALVGHLGLLRPLGSAEEEARQHVDLRVGVSVNTGNWHVQFALLANAPRRRGDDAPRALQVSASYDF